MTDEWTDRFETPITVTVLDTQTGERRTATGSSYGFWASGSGACDCNRGLLFPDTIEEYWASSRCWGCRRFVIVETSWGNLAELNEGYPPEVLQRAGL